MRGARDAPCRIISAEQNIAEFDAHVPVQGLARSVRVDNAPFFVCRLGSREKMRQTFRSTSFKWNLRFSSIGSGKIFLSKAMSFLTAWPWPRPTRPLQASEKCSSFPCKDLALPSCARPLSIADTRCSRSDTRMARWSRCDW